MTKPEYDGVLEPRITSPDVVDDSAPPDGGYGWVCCFVSPRSPFPPTSLTHHEAMLCINGFTWGILASYGVFLSWYINHDRFPGTTSLEYTFVGGLNFAAAMLSSFPVTIWIKHWGTNRPMFVGCIVWLLGFILAAEAKEFWHLLLTQGLLVGIGTGM